MRRGDSAPRGSSTALRIGGPIPPVRPLLTVVIPALNEEQSIASIVERCLAERPRLIEKCGLRDVRIVVVSDGSTDGTVAIARKFEPRITLVVFEKNRGYGAAIKEGWRVGGGDEPGDLLGFLDADGTCDPAYFAPMCEAAKAGRDVVLGNRMHGDSAMPPVRRVGNRLFAWLLGYLASERVKDTASGMRVVRRSALRALYPLPDGLHFTPAMSAVCLVHEDLTIAEVDMPYAEREGRSKLRIWRDGMRFLGSILTAAAIFRPRRIAMPVLVALVVASLVLAWPPVSMYARERRIEEGHIHQLLLIVLMGALGAMLFSATYVMEHLTAAGHLRLDRYEAGNDRLVSRGTYRMLVLLSGLGCLGAVLFAAPGFVEYVTTGTTTTHWSRFVLAMLAAVIFGQLAVTSLLLRVVRALARKLEAFHGGAVAPGPASTPR